MTDPTPGGPLPEATWASPLCAPWCRPGDIPENRLRSVDLGDIDEWETVCWQASELLYAASGRQWRGQPSLERTTSFWVEHEHGDRMCFLGPMRHYPQSWADLDAGRLSRIPVHTPRRIRLPDPDVVSLTSVTIGGVLVDDVELVPDSGGWLYRTKGFGHPGTVAEIVYQYGRAPGRSGVSVAVDLAVELAKWKVGDQSCALPSRITSVTREAVMWTFSDPYQLVKDGFTGISHIDQWLRSVNPNMRASEAMILSPDLFTAR